MFRAVNETTLKLKIALITCIIIVQYCRRKMIIYEKHFHLFEEHLYNPSTDTRTLNLPDYFLLFRTNPTFQLSFIGIRI